MRHVMLAARHRRIALVLVVGQAELLEEAVERAAGREVRHALHIAFGVAASGPS